VEFNLEKLNLLEENQKSQVWEYRECFCFEIKSSWWEIFSVERVELILRGLERICWVRKIITAFLFKGKACLVIFSTQKL
jgi:hypothetical protein